MFVFGVQTEDASYEALEIAQLMTPEDWTEVNWSRNSEDGINDSEILRAISVEEIGWEFTEELEYDTNQRINYRLLRQLSNKEIEIIQDRCSRFQAIWEEASGQAKEKIDFLDIVQFKLTATQVGN